MKVSVVIPTKGLFENFNISLDRLIRNTPEASEFIVVDDGAPSEVVAYLTEVSKKIPQISIIPNKRTEGFAGACNTGIQVSKGDVIVLINDDVLVGPNWYKRLQNGFYPSEVSPKPGIIGPTSNNVGGQQKTRFKTSPEQVDEHSEGVYRQNLKKTFVKASFLSGFCMAIRREVVNEVGLLDERFGLGGFEDNDFVLRAIEKGFDAVIVPYVFVYHYMSKTFGKMQKFPNDNYKIFYDIWRERLVNRNQKVVGLVRVKNGMPYFKECYNRLKELCDDVLILDTGSTDGTVEFLKEQNAKYLCKHATPFNETLERNWLIEWAREEKADWVFTVDADEVIDELLTKEKLKELITPINPHTMGYWIRDNTFWRGKDLIRVDGIWGQLSNTRLFKLLPNFKYIQLHAQGLHCGANSFLPVDCIMPSPFRLKHYGYCDFEQVKRKHKWYNEIDKDKQIAMIGTPNYDHLIDESEMQLVPYINDNSLTLAMCVRDESDLLASRLPFWVSAFHEVVIGVDDRTTDNSAEIAEMCGAKVISIKFNDSFANLRNQVLKQCSSRWILMLDADEEVDLRQVLVATDRDCDAYMFYVNNHLKNGKISSTDNIRLFKNNDIIKFTGRCHETVEEAVNKMNVRRASIVIDHYGYLKPEMKVSGKLKEYERLNRLQMKDDPTDARPYFNIALHSVNEGKEDEAEQLLLKALAYNSRFAAAAANLGYLYIRKAANALAYAMTQYPQEHAKRRQLEAIIKELAPYTSVEKVGE